MTLLAYETGRFSHCPLIGSALYTKVLQYEIDELVTPMRSEKWSAEQMFEDSRYERVVEVKVTPRTPRACAMLVQ